MELYARTKDGLPFTKPLNKALDEQKKRVDMNFASMIIIDGMIGKGKTTLAVEVADYLNGKPIDMNLQIASGGSDFVRKLRENHGKNNVIIYDEAGDFNTRGSLTRFNQMLNRVFETYRAYKILVILTLPDFSAIDRSLFRKGIPRMMLHCTARGKTYGLFSVYSLTHMFYILDYMKTIRVPPQAYNIVRPCFRGEFFDLSVERREELRKLTTEQKLKILEKAEISLDHLLTIKDIAGLLGKSMEWVFENLKKLSITPAKQFKKQLFYNEDVVDLLAQKKHFENLQELKITKEENQDGNTNR